MSPDAERAMNLYISLLNLYPEKATTLARVLQGFYDDTITNSDFTFLMYHSNRGRYLMPSPTYYIGEL
jgi:hypothetical protein